MSLGQWANVYTRPTDASPIIRIDSAGTTTRRRPSPYVFEGQEGQKSVESDRSRDVAAGEGGAQRELD